MGLTRVRVVLTRGYLKIRTTANRKSTYKTLNVPLKEEYWNKEDQEVRRNHPEYEKLNAYIREELRKHILYGGLPTKTIQGEPDIVAYFERHITNTSNVGTKEMRKATLKKVVVFLNKNNLQELRLSDLSGEHVYNFYHHLLSEVSVNTAAHHVRMFKAVVNKAILEGRVHYPFNPFDILKKKMRRVEPEIYGLSAIEISQLMQEHHFRPNKHLAAFLFSLFAQGMRKSDMIMLRWENFDYHYEKLFCSFLVKKTKRPIKIELSEMAILFLVMQLEIYNPSIGCTIQKLNEKIKRHRQDLEEKERLLTKLAEITTEGKQRLLQNEDFQNSDNKHLTLYKTIEDLKYKISFHLTSIREYEQDVYEAIAKEVHLISLKEPKEFVFDYLKGATISKYQSENEWRLIDNKSKQYNYHLKKIGKEVDFKNLHPHLARHSYARMLDEDNTSIQTIQKLIGHSDPQRTVGYIRRLTKEAENDANHKLAERFKKVRFQGIP